uniref:SCP domain-containing protein n=1 Tax=Mesocestoides corti TaxID=53468 RepID=A0A5K3FYY5_MESCO
MAQNLLCLLVLASAVAGLLPSAKERNEILEAHREIRKRVEPTAANMLAMEYFDHLENLALSWVSLCRPEKPDIKRFPKYRDFGAILTASQEETFNYTDFLTSYEVEKLSYNYEKNYCTGYCKNYLQLVTATSNRVGCATMNCDKKGSSGYKIKHLGLCLYKHAIGVNERPYKKGTSCSGCFERAWCIQKQCF